MLLIGQNIQKEFGTQKVLDIKKIEINDGGRIGLVGGEWSWQDNIDKKSC